MQTFDTLADACGFAYQQAQELALTYRVWRAEEGKPACCIAWFLPSYERLLELQRNEEVSPAA
jgi:hypothetical protein